jgi:hypothetical protein
LRAKTKSFFEDTFLLLIIAVLIYLAYSFFFSSDEGTEIVEENKTTIEQKVEALIHEKLLNNIVTKEEIKKDEKISEQINNNEQNSPQETQTQREQIEEVISNKNSPAIEETIEPIKETIESLATVKEEKAVVSEEKPVVELSDEKAKMVSFNQGIEQKIYSIIEKNIDKSLIKNDDYTNIRVTILKDGNYEQLTFIDGNKNYFNLIKSSIIQAFPIEMDSSLKNNFPRYFRMKIQNK